VRVAKTTKEIDVDELEQLTKPEARATAAFDARELQGLLDQSRRDDDDLEIPIAPLPAASTPASSTPIPKLTAPIAAVSNVAPTPMHATASSNVAPIHTNDFDDVPVYSPPSSTVPPRIARGSANTPKAHRPLTKPESMKRPARASSLVPWIVVALSAAVIVALALWR
jgi:hypothetical protein